MAQKTIVQLTDDLDGSEATQTVEFGYQGQTYKLDLSDQNASELEEALAPYIAAAQKVAGAGGSGRGRGRRSAAPRQRAGGGDYDPKDVRAWAQSNGLEVPARGRIPAKVIEQFKAAQA